MSDWLGWRKPPEEKPAPEGPVALAPIESIDVEAAYRARVGPVSRGILFLFRYVPLSMTYSFFAAFVFVGAATQLALVGLGIAGDLLRWRYAPDLKLADREWVGLFCDGEWSAEAAQAYDHWYCGLEKPFLLLGIGYLVAMFFLELFVPAPAFAAYMDLFAPLHDWTREHLYIAAKHSADLIAHGYGHRVAFLVHLLMVAIFMALTTPVLFCIGGNDWIRKYHVRNAMKKETILARRKMEEPIGKSIYLMIFSGFWLLSTFLVLFLFRIESISWNGCGRYTICPQYNYFSIVFEIIISIISYSIILTLLVTLMATAKAGSIRFAQITSGEKNNGCR